MSIFHHPNIHFETPDPLADGLNDDIAAERQEAESFDTLNDMSGEELGEHWSAIVQDIEKDPSWFDFSED